MSNPRTGQPLRGEELWRWANMQEIQGHYDDRGPTDGGRPLAGYHHGYGHWDNGPGYGGDNVERSYAGQARPEEYSPSLRRYRSPQRYRSRLCPLATAHNSEALGLFPTLNLHYPHD